MNLIGLTSIIITPFQASGELDLKSLENLIENTLSTGITAVTALGVAAEAHKLSPNERALLSKRIFEIIDGRCPVIVGTSANTTSEVIKMTKSALDLGARGVMIAPPNSWTFGPELITHYKNVAESTSLPIVLQDYEEVTQVHMEPEDIAELCTLIPQITAIKLESIPTPVKILSTRQLVGKKISIVGGIGGVYFFEELVSGADGTMTGFAFPEKLIEIWRSFNNGDLIGSKNSFENIRQVLEFEGQPKIGLAIRKEILRRRGWIENSSVRHEPPLSIDILKQLEKVLESIQL